MSVSMPIYVFVYMHVCVPVFVCLLVCVCYRPKGKVMFSFCLSVILSTIDLIATGSLLIHVTARLVSMLLECLLVCVCAGVYVYLFVYAVCVRVCVLMRAHLSLIGSTVFCSIRPTSQHRNVGWSHFIQILMFN